MVKIVYIAHPIAADEKFTTDENVADLLRIIKIINLADTGFAPTVIPLAPYIGDVMSMQDDNPLHRKRGIENDIAVIETGMFEELWLTGHKISLGMNEEIKLFVKQGRTVVNLIGKI